MFHGTAHEFQPGEIVEPRGGRGAFSTSEIIDARHWAIKAAQRLGAEKGFVYEVEPVKEGDIQRYPGGLTIHHSMEGLRPKRLVETVDKPNYDE